MKYEKFDNGYENKINEFIRKRIDDESIQKECSFIGMVMLGGITVAFEVLGESSKSKEEILAKLNKAKKFFSPKLDLKSPTATILRSRWITVLINLKKYVYANAEGNYKLRDAAELIYRVGKDLANITWGDRKL